ncbi:hypothetical protein K388_05817 [Streptomyces sp. KhCrAH-43]|uniref:hypothetical protein n=1 Tax=unclassified Streptomyces TaxID=2593676 RepID=UPI00036AB0FB|nr:MULTISPECIES: hypothetical protein [unclassified Streptomyces]MYS33487.1 hypothetical protein [Streptomyces sp. SID4920]MYX63921.1 hypothetical protein [Streptomyces sp. SID8373]RAJ52718.1 hypothetical protein K388_05817 [Streptomyces sp. KhCrAH-43]
MTAPDLNAGDLPHLTADRPRHRSATHRTTRELFGHDGQFFTVPGTFPGGLPDHVGFTDAVYAVLHAPNPATGEAEYSVRDVNGRRLTLGSPAPDQDTAIRSALSALAEKRRAHAQQVEHNRVHILGLAASPPVRIGHTETGTCVVHVRCSCPHVEGLAAHYEHVSLAVDGWLDEVPTTPWEFCPTSPIQITTERGTGRLTSTSRNDKGQAVVRLQHTDGRGEVIALIRVSDMI